MIKASQVMRVVAAGLMASGVGCSLGSRPSAVVGDPVVYRMTEVSGPIAGVDPVFEHLNRYFATTQTAYEAHRLRMDTMLEESQRASAYAQLLESKLLIDVAATMQGPTTAPAAPAGGNGVQVAALAPQSVQELKDLVAVAQTAPLSDSPSDRLDRATDFYTAYVLKQLRAFGDSRTVAPASPIAEPPTGVRFRKLWLVFQTHVHPGSRPNYMAGVRIKVLSIDTPCGPVDARSVSVLRLHPTRTYDLESSGVSTSIADIAALHAAANVPAEAVNAKLEFVKEMQKRSEARRKFITRVGKIASYADSDSSVFGWNFYPSNLIVTKTSWAAQFFQSRDQYEVQAFLEGGARDCLAEVIVPVNATAIHFRAYQVSAAIDAEHPIYNDVEQLRSGPNQTWRSEGAAARKVHDDDEKDGQFTVALPAWVAQEANPVVATADESDSSGASPARSKLGRTIASLGNDSDGTGGDLLAELAYRKAAMAAGLQDAETTLHDLDETVALLSQRATTGPADDDSLAGRQLRVYLANRDIAAATVAERAEQVRRLETIERAALEAFASTRPAPTTGRAP